MILFEIHDSDLESQIVKMTLERVQNIQVDFAVIKKSDIMETFKASEVERVGAAGTRGFNGQSVV